MASSASQPRVNMLLVGLAAAVIIPRVEELTGVKLTTGDVAALMALALSVGHGAMLAFERYFPPPAPKTVAAVEAAVKAATPETK